LPPTQATRGGRRKVARRGIVLAQRGEQDVEPVDDAQALLRARVGHEVLAGPGQNPDAMLGVEFGDGGFLDRLCRDLDRLTGIIGDQALIDAGCDIEHGRRAQQRLEEMKLGQVSTDHKQADGERRRQDEPDRTPERRPEGCRGDERQRGEAGAGPIEQRLHDVVADELQHQDEPDCQQHHVPAGIHREGEGDRKEGREHGPDIGDEAHQRGERAPEDPPRHADEPEPERHRDAVAHVHDQLHQEVTRDARSRLLHRLGHAVQVAAQEPDQPSAQIAAVEQGEEGEDEHDAGGGDPGQGRGQPFDGGADRRIRVRHHLDPRGRGGIVVPDRVLDLLPDRRDGLQGAIEHARTLHPRAKILDLRADGALIGGKLAAQDRHLRAHEEGQAEDERHDRQQDHRDRDHAGQAAPRQPGHQGAEGEADQKGDRERHEHALADIEPQQDDRHDDKPSGQPDDVGRSVAILGPRLRRDPFAPVGYVPRW
jgi:hypothetical protein